MICPNCNKNTLNCRPNSYQQLLHWCNNPECLLVSEKTLIATYYSFWDYSDDKKHLQIRNVIWAPLNTLVPWHEKELL